MKRYYTIISIFKEVIVNEQYIAYQTLLASREAVTWTTISALAAIISALATLVAAIAAVCALNTWKIQERARELKDLNVAVFRYQSAMNTAPDQIVEKKLDPLPFQGLMRLFDSLDNVYECTLAIHEKNIRRKASDLYIELANIHECYTSGKLHRKKAIELILFLRTNNQLLNPPR